MTQIQALSPSGFTATITCPESEGDVFGWLLEVDKWLAANQFKPLPLPQRSGGGNWNSGKANNTPRNWIDADGDLIYVFIAYVESKEKTAELKKEWGAKLKAATGLGYETDKSKFKDDKGREQWVWVFPKTAWRGIVDTLPTTEFEYREAFKTRVEAALAKAQA